MGIDHTQEAIEGLLRTYDIACGKCETPIFGSDLQAKRYHSGFQRRLVFETTCSIRECRKKGDITLSTETYEVISTSGFVFIKPRDPLVESEVVERAKKLLGLPR